MRCWETPSLAPPMLEHVHGPQALLCSIGLAPVVMCAQEASTQSTPSSFVGPHTEKWCMTLVLSPTSLNRAEDLAAEGFVGRGYC
mmetsp:Transcript_91472/g.111996  ORF Transcript_91472/g.111996 Transcript_91472/m.111996 type:complete len:85 (-) Transcript_91472:27-281(-)